MATPFPFGSGNVLTAAQMNAITTLPINDQTASYVALVGDVGKRIVMNVASGNTVTINNSVFSVGDEIFIANKGAGSTTVTAGAGVTINTASSLVLAQHGGGTLVALSASVFTFFSGGGNSYGTATGGSSSSITVGGINYTLLSFTTDATLTVTKAGLFDVMLIGGGGGGGTRNPSFGGGGGGAGGVAVATIFLAATTHAVDVGAGAAATLQGSSSYLGSLTVGSAVAPVGVGGGGGHSGFGLALNGGSGGGAANSSFGLGISGQGNSGAVGADTNTDAGGAGGGGGAGAAGSIGTISVGGAGGVGIEVNTFIGGISTFKAAGGGGQRKSGSSGAGGNGGGGAGTTTGTGVIGTANTGGGGGGGDTGGAGGSGIVYVRFKV